MERVRKHIALVKTYTTYENLLNGKEVRTLKGRETVKTKDKCLGQIKRVRKGFKPNNRDLTNKEPFKKIRIKEFKKIVFTCI